MQEQLQEQMFIVTLRASPRFYRHFPKVNARDLALTIRDSIRAKSRGCILPTRFEITVKLPNDLASLSGEIGCYMPELLGEIQDELALNPEH